MSSTNLTASLTAFGNTNSTAKLIADKIRFNLLNSSAIQIFLIAGISLIATNAAAQTAVWDGEADNNWVNGTNWVGNAAPGAGNHVSIKGTGVTNQPIISGGVTVSNASASIGDNGTVEVTGTGSTWTNNASLAVGSGGIGGLTIANGGTVSNSIFAALGRADDSAGTALVTGAGSTWTSFGTLHIGQYSTGDLTIANGGAVSNTIGSIGGYGVGESTVVVTGTGSSWTNSGILLVGHNGKGVLTISDGGTVSNSTYSSIGDDAGIHGSALVTGTASSWTNSSALNVGFDGTGELTIANGGTVSNTEGYIGTNFSGSGTVEVKGTDSAWTNSSFLEIGRSGTGKLTVADGGSVSSEYSYVGRYSNGDGTVEIKGTDSSWTNNAFLEIGQSGTGKLTIAGGGTVSNTAGNIGHNSGSDGTVEVTGTGSTWTNSSGLDVGDSGTGKLTIANGGTVSNTAAYIGHISGGDGTVEVTGTDSTWTNAGNLYVSEHGTGKLTIADGGAVSNTIGYIGTSSDGDGTVEVTGTNSSWTNSAILFVGYDGTGKLAIADAGMVSNTTGYIGYSFGGDGTIEVTGTNSSWTNSASITVGRSGKAKLTVAGGGAVSNTDGVIGDNSTGDGTVEVTGTGSTWTNSNNLVVGLHGAGKLTVANGGAVSNITAYIGADSGSDGSVEVTGTNSSWTNSSELSVGHTGTGKLTIADGGSVSNTQGIIGVLSGSDGTVEITGTGSTWTNSDPLVVGYNGTGKLTIANGGSASNTDGYIGYISGSDGMVEVTGAGSTWTNSGTLFVGHNGTGKLTIANGGSVSNTAGVIGHISSSDGTVEVKGDGSIWTNNGTLSVGLNDTGKLTIAGGGSVSNTDGYIGLSPGSDGTVEVTGTGSIWTNSLSLYVGSGSTGKLTIADGGAVSVNSGVGITHLAQSSGSIGTLNIGSAPMDAAIAAGTLNASSVVFGAGTGTLNFNHTDTNYQFAPDITYGSGTSALNHYAGFTNLSGTINISSTPTTIYGGTLAIGQTIGTFGAMSVRSGGILDLANNMNVGDTIAVNGNFEALAGSTLVVDVNHLNQSDTLTVAGSVALGSELSVMARGLEADYVLFEYEYLIIDNDSTDAVTGTFSGVTTNYAFLEPTVEYDGGDGNDVILTLSSTAADFQPFATNTNQAQTAGALNNGDYSSTDGIEVFGTFINLIDSQVPNVLDQLGGAALSAPTYLGSKVNKSVMDQLNTQLSLGGGSSGTAPSESQTALLGYGAMQDRLEDTQAFEGMGYNDPSSSDNTTSNVPNGLWTRMFGVRSQVSSDGNSPTINSEQYGVLLGTEFASNTDGLMGLAAGYSRGTYATNSVDGVSNSDNFHLAGYGKFGASNPFATGYGLSGTAAFTYQRFDTERKISFASLSRTAKADYNSTNYGAELRARFGYDKEGMIIAPFGELSYQNTQNEAFSETGAGILNLSAASQSIEHLTGDLGIEFAKSTQHEGRTHRAVASFAWSHEFLDTGLTNQFTMASSPTQFSIASPDETRNSLKLGLGIDFALNDATLLELGIRTNLSSTSTEYGASAAFKMRF